MTDFEASWPSLWQARGIVSTQHGCVPTHKRLELDQVPVGGLDAHPHTGTDPGPQPQVPLVVTAVPVSVGEPLRGVEKFLHWTM